MFCECAYHDYDVFSIMSCIYTTFGCYRSHLYLPIHHHITHGLIVSSSFVCIHHSHHNNNRYAYGMGGMETISYDKVEKILYGISEQGFITLIDQANAPEDAPQLPIVLEAEGTPTFISVCADRGLLFVVTKDDPNLGHVVVYKAASRSEDGSVTPPELLAKVDVGYGPDMSRPNSDCTMLAVANEGEGVVDDTLGLVNPPGSVSLINLEDLDNISSTDVPFLWSDEELMAKDIHLPLSLNALEYWDEHSAIADDVNFTLARATYTTASVLEPEWLEWTADDKYVLVNLQENAALVKINVETATAEDIYGYGLKSWEETPIDIIEDDGCATMPTVPGLFSVRTPDSIAVINIDGDTYVATANEGDDLGKLIGYTTIFLQHVQENTFLLFESCVI
jgi:hypothetical protein